MSKISVKHDVTMISLGYDSEKKNEVISFFKLLSENKINIDMISLTPPLASNISLCFTIEDTSFEYILSLVGNFREIDENFKISVRSSTGKVLISDEKMKYKAGFAANILSILNAADIEVIMITTSETEISVLVNESDLGKSVKNISECL